MRTSHPDPPTGGEGSPCFLRPLPDSLKRLITRRVEPGVAFAFSIEPDEDRAGQRPGALEHNRVVVDRQDTRFCALAEYQHRVFMCSRVQVFKVDWY